MREHDLQPRRRKRFVATTDSDHDGPIFPNLAKDVTADGPNQLWTTKPSRTSPPIFPGSSTRSTTPVGSIPR